jgi:hypothetical protein
MKRIGLYSLAVIAALAPTVIVWIAFIDIYHRIAQILGW